MKANKQEIVSQLRKQMLEMQGFKPVTSGDALQFGLDAIELCFPNSIFPLGTIHEFLSEKPEDTAASEGFISGLLGKMMECGSACLWISRNRKLFPPSMQAFGVNPQQVIFIDLTYEKEILWAMEEALKCEGLACVIAELSDIDFAQSRRLQLATEKSCVTGILLRKEPKRSLSATACTVRWQIKPLPTAFGTDIPGVGYPRWEVNLLKVKNGHTGKFLIEWAEDHFASFEQHTELFVPHTKQVS